MKRQVFTFNCLFVSDNLRQAQKNEFSHFAAARIKVRLYGIIFAGPCFFFLRPDDFIFAKVFEGIDCLPHVNKMMTDSLVDIRRTDT